MFNNHLKIAWRNLWKNRGYSAIHIGGLGVGIAVVLLISLWIYDELTFNTGHAKNRPIGYDKEGLVQIPTFSPDFEGKYDLMRAEFLDSGAVVEMSSSSSPTTQIWSNRNGFDWEGKPEGFQEDLAWTEVSWEYAKSLNLKIVEGRDFSREFPSDSNAVLLNQTAVKYMGNAQELFTYGIGLNKMEKHKEALKIFEANYDKNPDDVYAHLGMVSGHYYLDQKRKALQFCESAKKATTNKLFLDYIDGLVKAINEGGEIFQ